MFEQHHPEHIAPTFVADGNGGVMMVTALCDRARDAATAREQTNANAASRLEDLFHPIPGALHFARNFFSGVGERATLDIFINPPIC